LSYVVAGGILAGFPTLSIYHTLDLRAAASVDWRILGPLIPPGYQPKDLSKHLSYD